MLEPRHRARESSKRDSLSRDPIRHLINTSLALRPRRDGNTWLNAEGAAMEVFDKIRAGVAGDRSQNYKDLDYEDLANAFYGANWPGAKVSQGTLDQF